VDISTRDVALVARGFPRSSRPAVAPTASGREVGMCPDVMCHIE
jgi:hypothetical protein